MWRASGPVSRPCSSRSPEGACATDADCIPGAHSEGSPAVSGGPARGHDVRRGADRDRLVLRVHIRRRRRQSGTQPHSGPGVRFGRDCAHAGRGAAPRSRFRAGREARDSGGGPRSRAQGQSDGGLRHAEKLHGGSHALEMRMLQGMLAGAVMSAAGRQLSGGRELTAPFQVNSEAVTSGRGITYNGYAHSFGGMGIQFLLMVGVEVGVKLLLHRQQGVWKRMRAAPLSRTMLLGSRAVNSGITSMGTLIILFAFARVVFGVRIQGSMAGFLAVCAAFSLMTAAFGLLIASVGKTADTTRGIAILATLFMVMLGGAWVPTFIFPKWLQAITVAIPTRWAMDGLDAVTWRGLGFSAVALPVALLAGCALLFGAVAVSRFRWEAD